MSAISGRFSNKGCAHFLPLPTQLPDGSEIPLPPILLGKLGSDPQKKTVCVYGHLDVQPAALEDGWDSEPFTLVERDGEGALPGGRAPKAAASPQQRHQHALGYPPRTSCLTDVDIGFGWEVSPGCSHSHTRTPVSCGSGVLCPGSAGLPQF